MNSKGAGFNTTVTRCVSYHKEKLRGVFYGDDPFRYPTTALLAQLSLSAFCTACLQYILTPLGESGFFCSMVVGMVIGPSLLGKPGTFIRQIFPPNSWYVNRTFAFFGCMLFMFLVGVKTDVGIVMRSGKKALMIGACTFFLPLIMSTTVAVLLREYVEMDAELHKQLFYIASFQSLTSFHVIVCLLADLKLLNSELGHLATSASMICGMLAWIWIVISFTGSQTKAKQDTEIWIMLSAVCLLILVMYILRPIMLWMVQQTQTNEGRVDVRESYIHLIFLMILVCSLFGEVVGQHFMVGPMILGLAVPDGPPLGSALVTKLESYVSSILLPTYFVLTCAMINLSSIELKTVGIVEFLALSSFIGKVLGSMLPSLYCKMPFIEAFSLGLIMSAQGITDVLILQHALFAAMINEEAYSIMALSMVLLTGITTPIVKLLYNPSKHYRCIRRRTIQNAGSEAELRVLSCIYHQDSTPSVINLVEASNPTPKSPICLYVIHLMELQGRSSPLLTYHRPGKDTPLKYSNFSEQIIGAFRLYEKNNPGSLMVNSFTAISPYTSMHHQICELASEKKVFMVIVPFHKIWTLQGMEELPAVRAVNRELLRVAPCSVGILVDRGTLSGSNSSTSKSLYNIGVIFIEGPDDREALAYAMRMGEHPSVGLTVVRLIDSTGKNKNIVDREVDDGVVNEFKTTSHYYKEDFVNNCVEMVGIIRSVENSFDLVMVGRRHGSESPLFAGLTDWNEFPELGFVGDMLVSTDSSCEVSVLVMQQQI